MLQKSSFVLKYNKNIDLFLKKRGVKSPDELDNTPNTDGSPNERQTYEKYRKVLSKGELSVGDIKLFLQGQIGIIEQKWKDYNTPQAKKAELIPYHTVYKTLESAIGAPQAEREQLETTLNQLLN